MNKNMAGILSAAAVLTMLAGCTAYDRTKDQFVQPVGSDSNLLIVFYVQIMPDDLVMQLHRF